MTQILKHLKRSGDNSTFEQVDAVKWKKETINQLIATQEINYHLKNYFQVMQMMNGQKLIHQDKVSGDQFLKLQDFTLESTLLDNLYEMLIFNYDLNLLILN